MTATSSLLALAIACFLALGVFVFVLIGGAGLDVALRRAARAGLLVLVATWLRAAAGASGLREVSRRTLRRLRGLPAAREASLVLEELGTGRQLGPAASSIMEVLRPVPKRPMPVLDAVLGWVAAESARFRAVPPASPHGFVRGLSTRVLFLLALAPAAAADRLGRQRRHELDEPARVPQRRAVPEADECRFERREPPRRLAVARRVGSEDPLRLP